MPEEKFTGEDFLVRLRKQTAPAHQQLEQAPVSKMLLHASVTKDQYANYLALMYPVMQDTESHIFPLLEGIVPELEERRKTSLLAKDITLLKSAAKLSADLPFSGSATNAFTPAFALGIMYVTEGATLGGRMILKHVSKSLHIDENSGAAFFNGYGEHTGSYWKSFLEALTKYGEESGASEEVIAGAVFAFERIHHYFTTASRV